MALRLRSLSINLPFGLGGVHVEVTQAQARAAWNLYVEMATRVAVAPLGPAAGSAREALNSLYTLFGTTREVLRAAGPEIADGPEALGPLAIRVLNEGLRPFMARWHARLLTFEVTQGVGRDDSTWPERAEFDADLQRVQSELAKYVTVLADIAGVSR
jgi:hypothetical protein